MKRAIRRPFVPWLRSVSLASALGWLLMTWTLAACAHARADGGDAVAPGLETPKHTTLVTDGAFSLRRYAPYVVGQTFVDEPDMDSASRAGFRRLAGYIFGGNQGRREIAMTAPVTSEVASAAQRDGEKGEKIAMTAPVGAEPTATGWRITFMMPSQYSVEALPVPNDPRVSFAQVPGQCRAVVTFSWLTTDDRVQAHTDALRTWLGARGLTAKGKPVLARYNDPFTLPWNRTNEIWIDVEGAGCGAG